MNGKSDRVEVDPNQPCPRRQMSDVRRGQVYDTGAAYICENLAKGKCTFKMSKTILQREIPPDQMRKMLLEGKSDRFEEIYFEERPPI